MEEKELLDIRAKELSFKDWEDYKKTLHYVIDEKREWINEKVKKNHIKDMEVFADIAIAEYNQEIQKKEKAGKDYANKRVDWYCTECEEWKDKGADCKGNHEWQGYVDHYDALRAIECDKTEASQSKEKNSGGD